MKRLLLPFLILFPLFVFAQQSAVDKITTMGRDDNQVMKHLDVVCNRFGGRLIGSNSYDNAAQWAATKFAEWGYDVKLEEAGEVPVGFNRGPWFGRLIGETSMNLHFVTPSYTAGTHGAERGKVLIEPKTLDELNRMKGELKGAWVLVGGQSTGFPISHSASSDSLRALTLVKNDSIAKLNREIMRSNYENHTDKPMIEYADMPALFYRQMVDAGVRGFIQRARVPMQALYDRELVNNKNTTFDNLPDLCDIKLDEAQYDQIYRMVQQRRDVEIEFDIRNHFRMGPVKYHNVVAVKKGTKYPDQYVIVSGHLDAYDVATGGVDCGSGVSVAMEVARMIALSGARPERTMVFVLFAGEEFGLLGAQAYAKSHAKELANISCLFNRDGGPTPYVAFNCPESMVDDFEKICKPIRELYPDYDFKINALKPRKRPTQMGGTDASVFAIEGVPTLTPQSEDIKGYNFDYREIWHTERDLYTKSIPEYQQQAAFVTAILSLGTANLPKQMPRSEVYDN